MSNSRTANNNNALPYTPEQIAAIANRLQRERALEDMTMENGQHYVPRSVPRARGGYASVSARAPYVGRPFNPPRAATAPTSMQAQQSRLAELGLDVRHLRRALVTQHIFDESGECLVCKSREVDLCRCGPERPPTPEPKAEEVPVAPPPAAAAAAPTLSGLDIMAAIRAATAAIMEARAQPAASASTDAAASAAPTTE